MGRDGDLGSVFGTDEWDRLLVSSVEASSVYVRWMMGYFQSSFQCAHYQKEWERVLRQIQGWSIRSSISGDISQPLEAKALYVFSIARRLTRAAYGLSQQANGWKPIFLEATVLLFPMIELVGYVRVNDNDTKNASGNRQKRRDVSAVNLWAGLHWLLA